MSDYQVMPPLAPDEYAALRADITAHGVLVPVVRDQHGNLLDGHHRSAIAAELGIDCPAKVVPVDNDQHARTVARTLNLARRHLSSAQKRDLIREELAEDSHRSDRAIGRVLGVDNKTVGAVRRALTPPAEGEEFPHPGPVREDLTAPPDVPRPAPRAAPVMLTLRTHNGDEVPYPMPQGKATFNRTTGEGISWADWSWNPVTGCLHGCDYCYARGIATNERLKAAYPVGFTPLFHHERLDAPANTALPANATDAQRRVFVCSMADLYGRWVPQEWIDQVHAAELANPQWQYIHLTKFPDRYVDLDLPPSGWIGTSVDEQKRVRIAERAFSQIDGVAVKWLSLEPLREPLQFTDLSMFDWVVIGAQTATHQPEVGHVPAFDPPIEWVARIITQAKDAGCKVHLKPNLRERPGMQWLDEYPTGGGQ